MSSNPTPNGPLPTSQEKTDQEVSAHHSPLTTNQEEFAIRVQNLSKCYQIYDRPEDRLKQSLVPRLQRLIGKAPTQYAREFWALKDVSLDVTRGETIGIVGRNGSGKSTLLQMICGTLTPTSGTVETNGRIAALLELGSGFNPEFTGRENVYMNGAVLGLSRAEIDGCFDDIAAFADIGAFIEQPVKTYSSGMFVRLAFAIHANVDPQILIVDEALAVGDAHFVHRCMARFHDLQRRGATIILVSHDTSTVKRLCNRALWLKNGHLTLVGDATTVVDAYVQDLFGLGDKKDSMLNNGNSDALPSHRSYLDHDLVLPSGDGRCGEQKLQLTGMLLTDLEGMRTEAVGWNEAICLLIKITNKDLPPGKAIGCGYIVRDHKGIEIASASTLFEEVEIYAPAHGESLHVLIKITIPMLHPGHYSLTPSVSLIPEVGDPVIQDRILNAFVFEVMTDKRIVTPLRFSTQFTVLTPSSRLNW